MIKTYILVIAWKIHRLVSFKLICVLPFTSVVYEIIDF